MEASSQHILFLVETFGSQEGEKEILVFINTPSLVGLYFKCMEYLTILARMAQQGSWDLAVIWQHCTRTITCH